jgi:transcriptional regulator with XRE-family HTH domain
MMDNLSEWLANELKERGWSMRELARRADISHTTVAEVLARQRAPTWEFCIAVAKVLRLSPQRLFELAGLMEATAAPDETELLHAYRQLDSSRRELVLTIVQALAQRPAYRQDS